MNIRLGRRHCWLICLSGLLLMPIATLRQTERKFPGADATNGLRLGIPDENVGLHAFRHGLATELAESEPITVLQAADI